MMKYGKYRIVTFTAKRTLKAGTGMKEVNARAMLRGPVRGSV